MTNRPQRNKVESRNEVFTQKTVTKIWEEIPSDDNPYNAKAARCHGYDLFDLMAKRSFVDVLYLLFRGELPTKEEAKILETLMVGLINPGPRHPASRAAMVAGVGKSRSVHILPVASSILGGEYLGAGEIEDSMRFLRKSRRKPAEQIASELSKNIEAQDIEDIRIAPGFGNRNGSIDELAQNTAEKIATLASPGDTFTWGLEFAQAIQPLGLSWLSTGIAAAIFTDLGFQPRAGSGLYQLICAPGLLAHGVELANKPITAMPYVSDSNYVIED